MLSSFVPKNGKAANKFIVPLISDRHFFATAFPNDLLK